MTKLELQIEVTNWLALLEDREYDAALIVALGPFENEERSKRSNWVGFSPDPQQSMSQCYMDCIGALAENGFMQGIVERRELKKS